MTIPDGTPVEIRLTESLGSARNVTGQSFAATLDAPIVVDNAVVVVRGANVTGRVLYAKRSGRLKGPAELSVTLTSLEVGGQDYRIVTAHKSWRGYWRGGGRRRRNCDSPCHRQKGHRPAVRDQALLRTPQTRQCRLN